MTRLSLLRWAMVSTVLTVAFPLASYANAVGPTRPGNPSDTLSKLDKTKTERPVPAPRKKLKARSTVPTPSARPDFVPDQPWETEFYVDNDISGRHAIQLALASFPARR